MAFHIELTKIDSRNSDYIDYIYQYSVADEAIHSIKGKSRYKLKKVKGVIRISSLNGDVSVVRFAEGDSGAFAERAGWALIKCWRQRSFPDNTYWIS